MDHTASFDRGRGGDSGQNNKQRKFKGYESDAHSVESEAIEENFQEGNPTVSPRKQRRAKQKWAAF